MKREDYLRVANITPQTYKGKHEKRHYKVWRVVGPGGPEEQFKAYGLDQVKNAIRGCYDWEVQDANGVVVPDWIVLNI